jgi:glycosyltransferase involved in cell wall biosynthesis
MQKNILMIIPHLTDGGAERVVSELSLALASRYNIFVLLYENNTTYPMGGTKIIFKSQMIHKVSWINHLRMLNELREIKKNHSIDISISFLEHPNLINVLSKRKEKVIVTVHTHLSAYYKGRKPIGYLWSRIMSSILYDLSDYVVSVSQGVTLDLEKKFRIKKHKLKTIYNFYNIDHIRCLSEESLRPEHLHIFFKPVIVNAGRLTNSKGQWNLIKAFKDLKSRNDVNLVILGDGKYRELYSRFVKESGLQDSVFLLGFQDNPYALIKNAKVLISSSKFEGLSNVIIEAIAIGTPVISTDCQSGPREILDPDTTKYSTVTSKIEMSQFGILVPVKHPEAINFSDEITFEEKEMSNALSLILEDENIRIKYSKLGQERSYHFSVDQQVKEWVKIIDTEYDT